MTETEDCTLLEEEDFDMKELFGKDVLHGLPGAEEAIMSQVKALRRSGTKQAKASQKAGAKAAAKIGSKEPLQLLANPVGIVSDLT